MFQAARNARGSGEKPVERDVREPRLILEIAAADTGVYARKSDLFEVKVAVRVPLVLLLGRERPAAASEVGAVLVDGNRVLGVSGIRIQDRVIDQHCGDAEVARDPGHPSGPWKDRLKEATEPAKTDQ